MRGIIKMTLELSRQEKLKLSFRCMLNKQEDKCVEESLRP